MMAPVRDPFRRVRIGLAALVLVLVAGTVGYMVLGFGFLDAVYQTVVTITTVGYGFPTPCTWPGRYSPIFLILGGVGTALYSFSVVLELLIEGHMRDLVRRRSMERNIARMSGHVVVCGWGRVGAKWPASLPLRGARSWWSTATPRAWRRCRFRGSSGT